MATIRNPVEWSYDLLKSASQHAASIVQSLAGDEQANASLPTVNRIQLSDLEDAIR